MKERIYTMVSNALAKLGAEGIEFAVEYPPDLSHGDYAINAAMVAAKRLGKSPLELAGSLARIIKDGMGDDATHVFVAGPGFINISFSASFYEHVLEEALRAGDAWGSTAMLSGKRVIIEYANPNPFKEMHIGHLMGAIIGESLARLFENAGAHTARDTFGGDVGPHVAKALFGLKYAHISTPASSKEIGEAYVYGSRAYEDSTDVREKIDKLNVTLYSVLEKHFKNEKLTTDEQGLYETWEVGRKVSVGAFEALYKKLGIRFDYVFYDSDTVATGLEVVERGLASGVFEKSEGAIVYHGEKKGLHTLVFVTSRGTPTYETKDLGLAILKEKKFPSDKSIIITANEQIGHFNVVLSALSEIENALARKTVHVSHGFMRLTTGKMSSRHGTVITASGLIDNVIAIAKEKNEDDEVATKVAIGAIVYMVLRQSPGADIIFDPEKSLSLEGDSGPYLQYALVRALSVLRTASKDGRGTLHADAEASACKVPPEPHDLLRILVQFPDVVAYAQERLAPNFLVTYLTKLASQWNTFYANERIIGGEYEEYTLRMVRLFAQTMSKGMKLLGVPTLEKM